MKCQRCADRAVIHVTEILDHGIDEHHFCTKCAQRYMSDEEPAEAAAAAAVSGAALAQAAEALACPVCKTTFAQFRATGRLGCPNDYEAFRDELRPLIENIHGGLRHVGKTPRAEPAARRLHTDVIRLRQELQQAVAREEYERAAAIRDQIEALERA